MRKHAYAIRVIHRTGGGWTAVGETPEVARIEARLRMPDRDARGEYVLCTVPFPIERVDAHGSRLWDASLPDDVAEAIGEEMTRLAKSA